MESGKITVQANINNYVRVKLTKIGAAILTYRSYNLPKQYWKTYAEGDIWETQLWELASVFGPNFNLGLQPPIDTSFEIFDCSVLEQSQIRSVS